MRETDWAPARPFDGPLVARPGFAVRALTGIGQTLVSGDCEAAFRAIAPGAPTLGLFESVPEAAAAYALRIAHDRALIVTPAPLALEDGFRDGFCVTHMDDGYAALIIEGDGAPLVLMQGCAEDLSAGSPSAAVLFAGFRVLLARTEAGFRLHVERSWAEALLTWFDGASGGPDPQKSRLA